MNNFAKNLAKSNKEIKEQRAEIVGNDAAMAQEDLVRNLKKKQNSLKSKLLSLQDLNCDSKDSLNPVRSDFDADKWVQEVQDTKVELLNVKIELKVAEETNEEWFSEVTENDKTKED